MLRNRTQKKNEIINIITGNIDEINKRYRSGPDLYFYNRLNELRSESENIDKFLSSNYNIEIAYATLVAWDMNSRGAKMKYFTEFKNNLISCKDKFIEIEKYQNSYTTNSISFANFDLLRETYQNLELMKTGGKLVSNSKLLHFLFPKIFMPMDRTNTLTYIYGNTNESINKYIEIIEFSFDIIESINDWNGYLDNQWNVSPPKIIDNAIILLVGKSVK